MRDQSEAQGSEPGLRSTAGVLDTLRFNLRYVVPNILQGLFIRRPRWVALFARLNRGFVSAGLGPRLRELYGGKAARMRFLSKPALLLFDGEAIQRVLDNSPDTYGPPVAKCRGMAHFQPAAVTVSTGVDWQRRRAFNMAALGDPYADMELAAIVHAVCTEEGAALGAKAELRWADFAHTSQRIMLRVVFGRADEDHRTAHEMLRALMSRANWLIVRPSVRRLKAFQARLQGLIASAAPGTLAFRARTLSNAARIPIADQITHWMFAMSDTLSENLARAAGVIHAIPRSRDLARQEVQNVNLLNPTAPSLLKYIRACLEETMRLWPSTPFIVREALHTDTICGHRITPGDQLVIPNVLNHVDPRAVARALEWYPERWLEHPPPSNFYHLSGGAQSCAGAAIARYVGTQVLAELVNASEFSTHKPRIVSAQRLPASYNPFAIRLVAANPRA
jgi:cytochrome P450